MRAQRCMKDTKVIKEYYKKLTKLGYIRSMKVCSFEISFKLKSVTDRGIKFDNNFGIMF